MRISTDRLSYKDKVFSEEVSTLSDGKRAFNWTRLCPNAKTCTCVCHVGVILISHLTGEQVRYYLNDTHIDADNDTQYWELLPCAADVRKHPGVEGTKLLIWND